MSGSTASRALPNSDSVNLSGRFLRDGSSLWKHADLCQDAISADFAAPLDEIADWIRSAWRVIPSAGICSSQNPDSSLWVLSIVRSTNSQDRPIPVRFAVRFRPKAGSGIRIRIPSRVVVLGRADRTVVTTVAAFASALRPRSLQGAAW